VQPTASRNAAIAGSVVSVVFVALVAATPGSPFLPIQPAGAQPSGPLRSLAGLVGLDSLHGSALAAAGVVAVALAAVAFLFVLQEAWRGTISLRAVIALAIAYHALLLALPLLFSRDVYSYAYYGRIAATHHANPYVATPSDFPHDLLAPYIGPRWVDTPAVYGPLFTLVSSLVVRVFTSVGAMVVAFRAMAVAASLGTIAIVARLVHRVRPTREAFAVAILGLNPVVLFQSVGSGHNDLLVALSIAGALALVFAKRDLLATAVLALGTLVKATAGIPLLLLVVAVVARRERGARGRTLLAHLAVAGGIGLAFSLPFLQRKDPSLGMLELARHEGWLAPSRLFHRVLDAVSGGTLGVVARVAFPLALLAAVFLVARWLAGRGREVTPEAQGAAWGWGLLFLMLLGPVLLPWYVTWTLPLVWLLPRVPRAVAIGTGTALTVSQWTAEPALFAKAYDANVLFGHYMLTPVVVALLVWLCVDLLRRVRSGAPLDDQPGNVPARAGEG
jgi:alpha-1,6-mannosyltransferase